MKSAGVLGRRQGFEQRRRMNPGLSAIMHEVLTGSFCMFVGRMCAICCHLHAPLLGKFASYGATV